MDIACHHGGNEGTLATASAPSGSKIVFDWTYVSCCWHIFFSSWLKHVNFNLQWPGGESQIAIFQILTANRVYQTIRVQCLHTWHPATEIALNSARIMPSGLRSTLMAMILLVDSGQLLNWFQVGYFGVCQPRVCKALLRVSSRRTSDRRCIMDFYNSCQTRAWRVCKLWFLPIISIAQISIQACP